MKRKILILILSLILTASCFTGCKKTPPKDEEEPPVQDYGVAPYVPGQGIDKDKPVDTIVGGDGKSAYTIVIPSDADECIAYAAAELQKYIGSTAGAELPVRRDSQVLGSVATLKIISLGKTRFLSQAEFEIDYAALNYDGFIMKTRNSALFIDGAQNTAVLYGVYDFCEEVLEVKFLTAEAIVTPKLDGLPMFTFDRTEIPAFSGREYFAYQSMFDKSFAATLRQNSVYGASPPQVGDSSSAFYIGDGHSMGELLPYKVYGARHEAAVQANLRDKVWGVVSGTEFAEYNYTNGITDDGDYDGDPESLTGTVISLAKAVILAKPKGRYLMLGTVDNGTWCTNPRTAASDLKYGGRSGTMMVFINAVAKELEDWIRRDGIDREVNVACFAYWKTIDAPIANICGGQIITNSHDKDCKLPHTRHPKVIGRDNVIVKIAHMSCSHHTITDEKCKENEAFRGRFASWGEVAKRITIWDYATNFDHHFFWFPNLGTLSRQYMWYKSIGVERVMTQGAPHVGNYYQAHLENYLVSKLLWAPNRDVNQLIADFNKNYFGESAGGTVTRFVEHMNFRCAVLDTGLLGFHTYLYQSHDTGAFLGFQSYPKGFLDGARDMIQAEIDYVVNDASLTAEKKLESENRLLTVMIHPMYMLLYNYIAYYDGAGQKDFARSFFAITDRLGIRYYGEGKPINDLKTQYGVS